MEIISKEPENLDWNSIYLFTVDKNFYLLGTRISFYTSVIVWVNYSNWLLL